MGLHWAENTVEIAADADACFDAITDYESFPGWQSAVLATEVVERERKSKLAEIVKFEVDAKVRKVHYTLRYHYDRPARIWWDFIEGDGIRRLDGEYTFEQRGDSTLATYKVGIDPGAGIPGPVAKRVNKSTIKRANEDLKAETERRAGGGAAQSGDGPERVPDQGSAESVLDAAGEVVAASVNLAQVAGSRALGALKRFRP